MFVAHQSLTWSQRPANLTGHISLMLPCIIHHYCYTIWVATCITPPANALLGQMMTYVQGAVYKTGTIYCIKTSRHEFVSHYWSFVSGIHHSPVFSPHKGSIMRTFDSFAVLNIYKLSDKQFTVIRGAIGLLWHHWWVVMRLIPPTFHCLVNKWLLAYYGK